MSSRNYQLIFRKKKKTAQLKELGDKVQHYQNENQKREHASALKEDKLDVHVCFSAENFHEQDKYFRFYYILGCTFTFVFSHVKSRCNDMNL